MLDCATVDIHVLSISGKLGEAIFGTLGEMHLQFTLLSTETL